MPARNQVGGQRGERRECSQIKDRIGYDPARYLDVPLVEPSTDGEPKIHTAVSMIRGISRLGVANGWIKAERELGRGGEDDEDKPREQIMALLEAKVEYLAEHGSRPDELPVADDESPARYRRHDRDRPRSECYLLRTELDDEHETTVVERVPIEDARSSTARAKISERRTTENA